MTLFCFFYFCLYKQLKFWTDKDDVSFNVKWKRCGMGQPHQKPDKIDHYHLIERKSLIFLTEYWYYIPIETPARKRDKRSFRDVGTIYI